MQQPLHYIRVCGNPEVQLLHSLHIFWLLQQIYQLRSELAQSEGCMTCTDHKRQKAILFIVLGQHVLPQYTMLSESILAECWFGSDSMSKSDAQHQDDGDVLRYGLQPIIDYQLPFVPDSRQINPR